jgi:hypothetical protein
MEKSLAITSSDRLLNVDRQLDLIGKLDDGVFWTTAAADFFRS